MGTKVDDIANDTGQLSTWACLPLVLAGACAFALVAPTGASASSPEKGMIIFRAGEKVPESQLVDLGAPGNLGGTVLEGEPKISARIDYAHGQLLAGVFQATRGRVRITFPFTEHATILNGEVELTDQWGNTARLEAGDSYFIRQAARSSGMCGARPFRRHSSTGLRRTTHRGRWSSTGLATTSSSHS